MSVTGKVGCNSSTNDIVDRWGQDAGIIGKDEHIKTTHALGGSKEAFAKRNEPHGHDYADAGVTMAREGGLTLMEQWGKLGHVVEGAGLAGAAVVAGTVVGAYHLYKTWAEAHAKGDDLANRAHNDAVNCAIANGLAFDPKFGQAERAKRPGVAAGTEKLLEALKGKDAELRPILQGRADEGFNAYERAFAATNNAPADQRAAAMGKWLSDNGFADRQRSDIAFQKGGEYFLFTKSTAGVDAAAEAKKVTLAFRPSEGSRARPERRGRRPRRTYDASSLTS